jgi:hypothetical protein
MLSHGRVLAPVLVDVFPLLLLLLLLCLLCMTRLVFHIPTGRPELEV